MKKPVDFTYIRYANCWEDAQLLLQNVRVSPGERILSIASGGDNSLAFLATDPSMVLAFDINPAQLFLTELKQMAIKHLSYQDVLGLLGFSACEERILLFEQLNPYLSKDCFAYFKSNFKLISQGIIHQGKFENYFRLFRKYILPLVHNKSTIDQLFQPKSLSDQETFYKHEWNSFRWKFLFRFFFSKFILGRFGRDPAFFDEVKQDVAEAIFRRASLHLAGGAVSKNHFLDYQLRGHFSIALPLYLRPQYYERIRENIDRLQLFHGTLAAIPIQDKFDVLNLSNIFEYMNETVFSEHADAVAGLCNVNARVAYWNLLVERTLPSVHQRFGRQAVSGEDLCFFYQSFNVNTFK